MRSRCCAHRTGGHWHVICTDLDITVDGGSYEEVEASIKTGIMMHLERIVK